MILRLIGVNPVFKIKQALAPIMKLNRKGSKFSDWNEIHDKAFYKIQTLINNADILKHPEMDKDRCLYPWNGSCFDAER